ncbi:MAG: UDP-N-acetylmuramate--L-alanine ligase [Firmicutes bacterium]|nr:UDP-N-acetylmuramate--L-alanine ligase [Bacillota bacterium]
MEAKLHFIGIGGIGMSAIAKIMLHQGFKISGSDVVPGRLIDELIAAGAQVSFGHRAENIPDDCEAVVYSSAVKEDNPEMIEARRRGLKVYRRAEMLAYLMSTRRGIGVAGAHGKTTTSAMIATMLLHCQQDPTVIIGGMLPVIGGSNARAGDGPVLVAEADESDGTFLLLHPNIAVVTNIEADHLDHYGDFEHIKAAFEQYFRQIPADGFSVVCLDCPVCRDMAGRLPGRFITYSLQSDHEHSDADYTVENIIHIPSNYGGGVIADVFYQGLLLGRLQLQVGGAHNVSNALAAIAVGRELGLDFFQCARGLKEFTGTGRRFEVMGRFGSLTVVDDYAHHPTEISTTIRSARDQGARNLFTVFQPHRYSRTQDMYRQFADALADGGRVMLVELYPAFEKPIPGVSAHLIEEAMAQAGRKPFYAASIDEALTILQNELRDEDMLLIMGAGNVRQLSERFVEWKKENRF